MHLCLCMLGTTVGEISFFGIVITVTSHKRRGIPNHRQVDCLSHSLCELITKETTNLRIIGIASDRQIPRNDLVIGNVFPYRGTMCLPLSSISELQNQS